MAGAQCSLCHVGCKAIRVVQVVHADLLTFSLAPGSSTSYCSHGDIHRTPPIEESPPGPNTLRCCAPA
eukprot:9005367-Heterocapsa_arctica.AAC.1